MHLALRLVLLATALLCLALPQANAASFALRQRLVAAATGEGAPARGFGTQVAVDGDVAVVSDLASTLDIRRALVRTYVRTGGIWTQQSQVLSFNTTSPSLKVKLAMGGGTLAVLYRTPAGGSQMRYYLWEAGRWSLDESIGSGDQYESIAADGNIVVLGHPGTNVSNPNFNSGFVRAYRRDPAGDWNATQITPTGPQANQRFGHAVAIAAGAIVVGSPDFDATHGGNSTLFTNAGAAYVFELTGDTWNQAARLIEPDASLDHNIGYGHAVAISGAIPETPDRLLVSSQRNSNNAGTHVRSYTRTAGVWTWRQLFTSTLGDCFGCAMSLDGNWAVLGAPDSNETENFGGKVVVMQFANNFQSVLSTTDRFDSAGGTNDQMGVTVSIDRSGPTLFVGAPGAEVYGNSSEGVVMVGRGGEFGDPVPRTPRVLDLGQGLTNAFYGYAMATDADTLVIGALYEDVGLQNQRGAAYVLTRDSAGQYGAPVRLLAPDGVADDTFGSAVAIRGDVLLVGAADRSVQGIIEAGVVYAFRRTGGVWNLEAQLMAPTPTASGAFGYALAFDGVTAIVCGRLTPLSWVLERSAGGTWTHTQTLDSRCNTPQLVGDLLLLNDNGSDVPVQSAGEVVTYARSGGLWARQGTSLSGNAADVRFGWKTSFDGTLLAVSSVGASALPVQVYRRNGNGWLPEVTLLPDAIDSQAGCLSPAVHEGRIAIGCGNLPGPTGPGAVYVFERLNGTWTQTQPLTHANPLQGDQFGATVHFHADGSLFVAALYEASDFFAQGAVYRYAEPGLLRDGFEDSQ